jgi:hypothetical protein
MVHSFRNFSRAISRYKDLLLETSVGRPVREAECVLFRSAVPSLTGNPPLSREYVSHCLDVF